MTDVETLLRSTIKPGSAGTGGDPAGGWPAIERRARRRAIRRRRVERSALVLSVLAVAAVGIGVASGSLDLGITSPAGAGLRSEGRGRWITTPAALIALLALSGALLVTVVHRSRVAPARAPLADTMDRIVRRGLANKHGLAGIVIMAGGLSLPVLAYANYLGSIAGLEDRVSQLDGLVVVGTDRRQSPFTSSEPASVMTIELRPELARTLDEAGFEPGPEDGSFIRPAGEFNAPKPGWHHADAIVVRPDLEGGHRVLELRGRPRAERTWIPLATLL
ncbi:MAG: hypothetical protein ACR2QK_11960, partial [Acidimicrobiales bacterium]